MQTISPFIIRAMGKSEEDVQEAVSVGLAAYHSQQFVDTAATRFTNVHFNAVVAFVQKYVGQYRSTEVGDCFLRYYSDEVGAGVQITLQPKRIEYYRLLKNQQGQWVRSKVGEQPV